MLPQRLGGVRIAEEFGDAHQKILMERGQFPWIAFDQGGVLIEALDAPQRHAPLETPAQRASPVMDEVEPVRRAESPKDPFQQRLISVGALVGQCRQWGLQCHIPE